ncbi:MAG: class I mannose-6-phosphate isomerase [Atopobiaceae bacterium]|jgi:mannose-6-phosphate isomerase class I|nr:class I mannose-6-phosphate isomerase [Atopobiaceae bacterium]MCH4181219.1 class I mannose-6-phosphate isomerase [Atopobiaceae bacterium]MCH4214649.1 class I mannose-6-phosphate isomerase [Atopobiaceae bacterium]MCH4230144.1 class I mannose-6-phosphate isomerase [Atopobiaceae bacterium]MCH4275756.1 class I mannose-6-phosphate isomerase [Atopobiaceae bacterium]
METIYKISPYYEPRMWGGGTRLRDEFGYVTDVAPLGEVYNVVALPGHADCGVPELGCTLSELYSARPELFDCETQELPVRVNILDPIADLSIQIHPGDDFAKGYNGGRGKPEAWVILDAPKGSRIEFGHHATTLDQFKDWTEAHQWDELLRYLPAKKDAFIDIPTGTLHAIGDGVLTYNISRNADCTLRLYDYDRIEPATGTTREIQPEEVYENVNMPDKLIDFETYPAREELGVDVTRYTDQPGLYTLMRLQVSKAGRFLHDRFAFYTCVNGSGTVNGVPVTKGETILVPAGTGWLDLKGTMDLFLASYRNDNVAR